MHFSLGYLLLNQFKHNALQNDNMAERIWINNRFPGVLSSRLLPLSNLINLFHNICGILVEINNLMMWEKVIMIQLILSDMDGTLLDDKGNLPSDFDEVAELLRKRKILFAPASGRQYYALLRQFKRYSDEFIFICENGAHVVYQEKELLSSPLDRSVADEMLRIAADISSVHTVLCGKQSAYVTSRNAEFLHEVGRYYARCRIVQDFSEVEDEILKIAICDFSKGGAERNSYPHFLAHEKALQVLVSGKLWMDIMGRDVNKGMAVARIQRMLNISPDECAAFGDYPNDMELMRSVHHSYAMENAHPLIKETARYRAKRNTENGVMDMIREILRGQ